MNLVIRTVSVLRRLGIIIAIAITFLFGLATTVYLSLRSSEVRVPEVIGKDRFEAERVLADAGLNFRVRATRPSNQSKADTVLFQLPRAGEVVKVGQTVAMDISRAAKEGEAAEGEATDKRVAEEAENANREATDSAEKKPKRKPANKNTNENANANANRDTGNANANARNVNAATNASPGRNANDNEVRPNRNSDRQPEQRPSTRPTPAVRNTATPNP